MATPGCLSRRLILAISQTPSTKTTTLGCPSHLPPPKVWIRTITSSSKRQRSRQEPLVSFGKTNDDVLAPYLHKNADRARKITDNPNTAAASDNYEIDGFVDRSKPNSQELAQVSDDYTKVPERSIVKRDVSARSSKTRRPRREPFTNSRDEKTPETYARRPSRSVADRFGDDAHMRKPRTFSRDAESNASSSGGRQLARKVTEDAEKWAIQKNALKEKFKEGWEPRKKLSPDAQEGIRGLHEQDPITYSTEVLAKQFKQSPEAIRRILKSKWMSKQSPEMLQERRERWAKRHDRIWDAKAEIGQRPPRRKDKEVEDPDTFEQELERKRILGEI